MTFTVPPIVTENVWDGDWALLEEYVGPAIYVSHVYGFHGLIKTIQTDTLIQTLVYYYQDSLGSTTQIADVAGKLLETYTYDLYGQPTILSRVGSVLSATLFGVHDLFAGARWMDELGLYDMRNRFMSPEMGVFLQTDPIGFKGDASNLYRYVGNDWANKTDPMGLEVRLEAEKADQASDEDKQEFEKEFQTAKEQATTNRDGSVNKTASDAFKKADTKGVEVRIKETKDLKYSPDSQFTASILHNKRTGNYKIEKILIYWNPHAARQNTNHTRNSPAFILLHEILHAAKGIENPKGLINDFLGGVRQSADRFHSPEERRVLELEGKIAPQLRNEGVRNDWRGRFFHVNGADEGGQE